MRDPRQMRIPGGPRGAPTISTFSLVRFLIFSSIRWMLCSKSSFFLFMRLFFSTRGFSWTSVSRERFSCGWRETEGRAAVPSRRQGRSHPGLLRDWSCRHEDICWALQTPERAHRHLARKHSSPRASRGLGKVSQGAPCGGLADLPQAPLGERPMLSPQAHTPSTWTQEVVGHVRRGQSVQLPSPAWSPFSPRTDRSKRNTPQGADRPWAPCRAGPRAGGRGK